MRTTRGFARGASASALAMVLVCAATVPARAQAPATGTDKVAAEALFEDGRKLVAAGKYAEACPKFADSQRLDPSPGTLLNLANCYEKLGRSATAWATYKEAAGAANAAGRADYVATAQRRAESLAPKLARLTVTLAEPLEGMKVTRDGAKVERAEWGAPIPIDAGQHVLEASAPGHKSWSTSVDVPQDGALVTVSVPALEALPVEAPPPPQPQAPSPVPPGAGNPPGAEQDGSSGGTQRLIGLLIGGAGVVGLGVGGVFAVIAKNRYNDSLPNCHPDDVNVCNGTGFSQRNDARDAGNIATVAVSVGAAAVVGGAVIWLTAPRVVSSQPSSALRVGVAPTVGGAVLQGVW
jgi:hypothetical protein